VSLHTHEHSLDGTLTVILFNPLNDRDVTGYTLPSKSNLHFYFLTFRHSGTKPWAC